MVIQRWQSLLLFISALIIGAGLLLPVSTIPVAEEYVNSEIVPVVDKIYAIDVLPLFIVLCVVFLLLLIDIFLYKNLHLQKYVALVCVLLTLVAAGIGAYCGSISTVVMAVISAILTVVAYTRMKADERLLKSYDRIR